MNLKKALELKTSEVIGELRVEAEADLMREAIQAIVYDRAQALLAEARAAIAEAEAEFKEADAARVEAEAELEQAQAEFAEAREHYGEPPRSETEAAMDKAYQERLAAQERLEGYRSSVWASERRLEKLRDLAASLAAVAEPELDALRELAALM